MKKVAAAASKSAAAVELVAKQKRMGGLGIFLYNMTNNTCESYYDCEKTEVCCNFGFKKVCCRGGGLVFNGVQNGLQKIPIRVVADDDQWEWQRGGHDQDWWYQCHYVYYTR